MRPGSAPLLGGSAGLFSGYGVQFSAVGQYYSGANAAAFSEGCSTIRMVARVDAPWSTDVWHAGFSSGGGLIDSTLAYGGALASGVGVFPKYKSLTPNERGQLIYFYMWGGFAAIGGNLIGKGVPGIRPIPGSPLGIGGRGGVGTFSGASMTFVDVTLSSALLTPAEMHADALKPPGSPMVGGVHQYLASAAVGATWPDSIGTATLTRSGAPAVISLSGVPILRYGDPIEGFGNSILNGRQPPAPAPGPPADGIRRQIQVDAASQGLGVTWLGATATWAETKDYDIFTSAVGGQTLQTRLTTLDADLPANGPANTVTIGEYGTNDLVLGRTAAQLTTDWASFVAKVKAARPGKSIIICNVYLCGDAQYGFPGSKAQTVLFIANFLQMIVDLQAANPDVRIVGADWSVCVTNGNDPLQLYDTVHPTHEVYITNTNPPSLLTVTENAIRVAVR